MLSRRLVSAAIIISVMVTLVCIDHWLGRPAVLGLPGLVISLITSLACILAAAELVDLWRKGGAAPVSSAAVTAAMALLSFCSCIPMVAPGLAEAGLGLSGGAAVGMAGAIILIALWTLAVTHDPVGSHARTEGVARAILAVAYLFPLIASLAPHRLLQGHNGSGLCALLLILVTVKMSDAWAYGFGKTLGRTPMAPRLSPNKTVEGGLGGILGALFGTLIVFWLISPYVAGERFQQSFAWMAGYALTVALAGMAGDLFESLLKRDAGCKDSSRWFPGLGGILDVVDSLVFAAPASCLYWSLTGAG